jgi:hypothetical protein
VQVQCRLSIPSEFEGYGGSEAEPAGELLKLIAPLKVATTDDLVWMQLVQCG